MDNRRPPRSNSPGPGRYYERSRGPGTPRNTDAGNRDDNIGNSTAGSHSGGPARSRTGGGGPRRPGDRPYNGGPSNLRNRPGSGPPKDARGKKPQIIAPVVKITSDLQVMDGRFAGRLLGNSASPKASVMARSLRDSMLRIIARRVRGARYLDLCAGCGMIGLEAISRGAMLSTFVERSARSASFLRKNIAEMGIKDGHAEVVEMEAAPYLKRSGQRKRTWDIVFIGRTGSPGDAEIVEIVSRGRVIEPGGIAIIEHLSDQPMPEKMGLLTKWRTQEKDGTSLTFYNRR